MECRIEFVLRRILCIAFVVGASIAGREAAYSQQQPPRTVSTPNLMALLRNVHFRKEIEIVAEQQEQLQRVYDERNKMMSKAIQQMEKLPADTRQNFWSATLEQARSFEGHCNEVLLPHQQRRVEQLLLQKLIGAKHPSAGLTHPRMAALIEVSDSQRERIDAKAAETEMKLKQQIAELELQLKRVRDDARQKSLLEITEDQRRKYREFIGEVVDFEF